MKGAPEIEWNKNNIERLFRSKLDMKEYGPHIRLALTGQPTGIGLWDIMEILGEEETCRRLVAYMRKCGIEI